MNLNQILSKLIAVGQALEIGEIDHDKTWYIERAKLQILEQLKALLPENMEWQKHPLAKSSSYVNGFNQAIDQIEKAIEEWAK